MTRYLLSLFLFISAFGHLCAESIVSSLMLKMEEGVSLNSDLTAKIELTQQKVIQGTRKIESVYYRQDASDAFLLVNTAPE